MMRRRGLTILSILLLALTLLVGCGLGAETSDTRADQTTAALELLETTGAAGETAEAPAPAETTAAVQEAEESAGAAVETTVPETEALAERSMAAGEEPDEDGEYNSKEDVALYIHLYGHLPGNYITKKEAESLGWSGGSLERYAPGKSIGGSRFGNYEGLLPEKKGRKYTECDIDTKGKKSRGAKRIVFSNDGLIYYTDDHYESFELLYGEE